MPVLPIARLLGYMKKQGDLLKIGEFGLIRRLVERLPVGGTEIYLGIGDDAAAVDLGGGRLMLATCDIQIEDIHFTIAGFSPEQIGEKAAAVNLSDIAAMGGRPLYALVSIAVPQRMDASYIDRVYGGLGECLARWGAAVIGGNTAKSNDGLIIDMTLLGETEHSRLLTRRGAAPGDVVCVTGDLGASRAGLALLSDERLSVEASARAEALRRHRTPTPRLSEASVLADLGVSACMDVSDGLAGDTVRLAEQSGVCVTLCLNDVPAAPCATAVADALGLSPRTFALEGGEDFELLFTVTRERIDEISREIRSKTGTQITIIGEVTEGEGGWLTSPGGKVSLEQGFDHFK